MSLENITTLWDTRARSLCEHAACLIEDENATSDAVLSAITAAEVAFRISLGEVPPDELDDYPFPGEPDPLDNLAYCICPPEMVARDDGSFKGGCPVHARR